MSMQTRLLVKPLVSEKTNILSERLRQYVFIVEASANKIQIARAVEEYYNVGVERVNTARYQGKLKSRQTRKGLQVGRRPSYKKAIVTLREGDAIDFYSNI